MILDRDKRYSPLAMSLVRDIEVAREMALILRRCNDGMHDVLHYLEIAEGRARKVYDEFIEYEKLLDEHPAAPEYYVFSSGEMKKVTEAQMRRTLNISDEDDLPEAEDEFSYDPNDAMLLSKQEQEAKMKENIQ